jgi:hypothetical protein
LADLQLEPSSVLQRGPTTARLPTMVHVTTARMMDTAVIAIGSVVAAIGTNMKASGAVLAFVSAIKYFSADNSNEKAGTGPFGFTRLPDQASGKPIP